jgi:hypothetical protein
MLRTLFTLLFISSIVVSAKADEFTDGFVIGILLDSFDSDDCETNSTPVENTYTKYNLITVDTTLLDFPKTTTPQCYDEKVEVKSYIKIEWYHRLLARFIICLMLYPIAYSLFFGSDEHRRFMLGMLVARAYSRNRRC